MDVTVKEVIAGALKIKDSLEEDKRLYEDKIALKKEALKKAELWLLKYLNEQGLQNLAVKGLGIAFKRKVTSVSMADWGIAFPWMQENNRFDLLNHSVSKTGVQGFVEETGQPPPGVNYSETIEVSINRARAKADEEPA